MHSTTVKIEIFIPKRGWVCGLDRGQAVWSCENVNEPSSSIKCWVCDLIKCFICDKIQAYEADISCELYFVLRLWCDAKWGTVTSGWTALCQCSSSPTATASFWGLYQVSIFWGYGFCMLERTWVLYRDIILSNNSHHFSLIPLHLAAGSTFFNARSVCCKFVKKNPTSCNSVSEFLLFRIYMKLNMFRACAWQHPPTTRPTTFHVWKTRGCQCSFRLLMMGSVSPKTCWTSYKYGIIKFWYIVASCWIFLYKLHYDARIHERQVAVRSGQCISFECVSVNIMLLLTDLK